MEWEREFPDNPRGKTEIRTQIKVLKENRASENPVAGRNFNQREGEHTSAAEKAALAESRSEAAHFARAVVVEAEKQQADKVAREQAEVDAAAESKRAGDASLATAAAEDKEKAKVVAKCASAEAGLEVERARAEVEVKVEVEATAEEEEESSDDLAGDFFSRQRQKASQRRLGLEKRLSGDLTAEEEEAKAEGERARVALATADAEEGNSRTQRQKWAALVTAAGAGNNAGPGPEDDRDDAHELQCEYCDEVYGDHTALFDHEDDCTSNPATIAATKRNCATDAAADKTEAVAAAQPELSAALPGGGGPKLETKTTKATAHTFYGAVEASSSDEKDGGKLRPSPVATRRRRASQVARPWGACHVTESRRRAHIARLHHVAVLWRCRPTIPKRGGGHVHSGVGAGDTVAQRTQAQNSVCDAHPNPVQGQSGAPRTFPPSAQAVGGI